ncbi:NCS2 family permease [candidate division KSB1 bacterium]|nr:NCS2 family permease [candidate division KSB1 bacterium]
MIRSFFKFEERNTDFKTETIGGATTFMTMSYIIFVQPVILGMAIGSKMDTGAVMVATCISSAIATLLMGLLANYPIALAPAMGHNLFFSLIVCGAMGYNWQVGLGAVFISGTIFTILSAFRLWEPLVQAVPDALKHSIATGIGLLIALIGLEYGGVIVDTPNVYVGLGELGSAPVIMTFTGLIIISILMTLRVPGAILIGIIATAILGIQLDIVQYEGVISAPPSISPTLFKLDIVGALKTGFIPVVFVFFMLDLFDTMGTLIGVSDQAGFIKDGRLPKASRAMLADAIGTIAGAVLGTSTVTSYIESLTGISQGARTGFANLITALLFLLALFFSPLTKMIGGTFIYEKVIAGEVVAMQLHPVIAPALVIVGYLIMKCVTRIDWDDATEAIPAFLVIIMMPLTLSITDGIAFGFISYTLLKLASGRGREVHWVVYLFAVLSILRYIFQ